MNPKNKLRAIAEETLQILASGHFRTPAGNIISIAETQQFAVNNTVVYSPELSELTAKKHIPKTNGITHIEVTGETTLDAVRRLIPSGLQDVVCLNFASAKNPGGGFLGGAQAQEESIARATGLYPCQLKALDYYKANRAASSCFYTDYMIYSPAVPILKDESGESMDCLMTTAIITAPAVNTGVVKHREPQRMPDIETTMKRRMEKVLAIALAHGHQSIVLGAWGCGVFQNDPDDIARWFKEVIEGRFQHDFSNVTFAIYSKNERFIRPFLENFGSQPSIQP